jgi:ABC-2 type transport system permease protein
VVAAPQAGDGVVSVARIGGVGHVGPVSVQLAVRGIRSLLRLPSVFFPSVLFPVFLIVAFSGAYSGITRIPGFPTETILNWYVPLAICQGSAFVGVGMGMGATRDIEVGFFDRLLLAPVPRVAFLTGPALNAVTRVVLPFTVVLSIGLVGGARLEGGPVGLVTLFVAAAGTALVHAFWCLGIAFRARSQRAAPLMQLGVFTTIFLATAQVPLAVMTGWLESVARVNPMTNVLRLARAGFLGEVRWEDCWGGLLALGVAVVLAAVWARRSLERMVPG